MAYTITKSNINRRLYRSFILISFFWTLLIVVLMGVNCVISYKSALEMIKTNSKDLFDKEIAFRHKEMNARFESHKAGDSASFFIRTKNPSESFIAASSHFTSLNAKEPANMPDSWELNSLNRLKNGENEVFSIEGTGKNRNFRFMRPLYVDKLCLKCHQDQGLKIGDQLGGISVELPWEPVIEEIRSIIWLCFYIYSVIWILGIAGIWISWYLNQKYHLKQKRIEDELRIAIEKKELGTRLKEAFVYNISHELRTPLNGILGFSGLITEPDISDHERVQCQTYIKASSERLLTTITNYMDISMIATGTMEVHRKLLRTDTLIKDIKDKFMSLCDMKNLVLEFKPDVDNPSLILNTDPEMLLKILTHLVDNAIKFTSKGEVTVGYLLKQGQVEFFVQDTGIGIQEDSRERIFDYFVQEELSMSRGYEGSGLGLSISQGLAKLLGSEIHLDSIKGQGSLFYFSIPLDESGIRTSSFSFQKDKLPIIKNPVILIAEDDEFNFRFLESVLRKTRITILEASNGQEAVDQCRNHPEISLVLMDIKMPVKDGLQATIEIKGFRKELKIVAVTAYALPEDEKKALEAGCDDYLIKPTTRESIMNLMDKYGMSESA